MADGAWLRWGDQAVLEPKGAARAAMEAGLRVFDELGFAEATIDDLRHQADVSVGSIYHHFGDKDGLAAAVYVRALIGYQRGLAAVLRGTTDAEAGVRGVVDQHLRWVGRNPAAARLLTRRRELETRRLVEPRIEVLNRRMFGQIAMWYRPRAERGELRPLDQPLLHAVWLGPAQEYTRLALERPDRIADPDPPPAGPALADAAWASLRPGAG